MEGSCDVLAFGFGMSAAVFKGGGGGTSSSDEWFEFGRFEAEGRVWLLAMLADESALSEAESER